MLRDSPIEINRIYNQDCVEGMKSLPDGCIDLIVTDPPYLMNYQSNRRSKERRFNKIQNDINSYQLIKKSIDEFYRLLKNDSAIYIFCSWHHIDFFKQEFEKRFKLKNLIVWNKNNHGSGDLKGAYAPKHELILFGHKGRALFKEKRLPDVIDCAKIPSIKMLHPTEKPTELLETFIKNNSSCGEVVLDAFMGCGSTAVAAQNTGRNFIGFETDEQHYITACQRIKNRRLDIGA